MPLSTSWLIGVSLTFTARIITNFGLQIQKHAHTKIQLSGIAKKYIFDPLWIFGLILQVTGGLSDFFALSFAPQSVVAPIGSVSLMINMCLTPVIQHEKVAIKTVLITLCVALGTVITVIFSPKDHTHYESMEHIFAVYGTAYFFFYAVVIMSALAMFWTLTVRFPENPKIHGFAVPALSGMLTAQNVLFAKGVSTSITLSANGDGICFKHWEFYIVLGGLVMTLMGHLKWLNVGLKQYSPIRIIPISTTFAILTATVGGLVVFTEYKDFENQLSAAMFSVGACITTISVLGLSTIEAPVNRHGNRPDRTKYQLSKTNADLEMELPSNDQAFDFEMTEYPA